MSNDEILKAMQATITTIKDLLNKRLGNQVEALNAISNAPSLDSIPESVKEMREIEAGKIRAVMQEQKDLITIINALFPDGQG